MCIKSKVACACLIIILFTSTGCNNIPQDIRGTLSKVKNDTLVVGISNNPPWTILKEGQQPSGLEAALVKQFAKKLNAEIKWIEGSESDLLAQLEETKIYILIAGLTTASPLVKKAGYTVYLKNATGKHIIAIPPGENAFLMQLENFLHSWKNTVNIDNYKIGEK